MWSMAERKQACSLTIKLSIYSLIRFSIIFATAGSSQIAFPLSQSERVPFFGILASIPCFHSVGKIWDSQNFHTSGGGRLPETAGAATNVSAGRPPSPAAEMFSRLRGGTVRIRKLWLLAILSIRGGTLSVVIWLRTVMQCFFTSSAAHQLDEKLTILHTTIERCVTTCKHFRDVVYISEIIAFSASFACLAS